MDRIVEVKVNGNYITKDNKNAGAQGECNMTALRIEFDEGWDGFAKTVTWWNSRNQNPVKRTLTADQLEDITKSTRIYTTLIPGEPLEFPGMCRFVIDGYSDDKRQRSLQDELLVKPVERADDAGNPVDPIPSQAEQLQVQIDSMLGDMQERAVRAETAAAEAKASENSVKDSVETAAKSAAEALASENLANSYMQGAQFAAGSAAASAGTAAEHAQEAAGSAQAAAGQTAELMRSEMTGYVNAAQDAQRAAEKAKDEAKEIAGGDYATGGELDAVEQMVETVTQALDAHESDTNNPHGVTAEQVGAAPAGFGLGAEQGEGCSDCNSALRNGWYILSGATNAPSSPFYGWLEVTSRDASYKIQRAYDTGTKTVPSAERRMFDGAWQSWEWVNPPMSLGKEYRTIERITNKAVYKRNNGGTIEYRLDGETEWKPYADVVGALASVTPKYICASLDELKTALNTELADMKDYEHRNFTFGASVAYAPFGGGTWMGVLHKTTNDYAVVTLSSYNTGAAIIRTRSASKYGGTWTDWATNYHSGEKPTPADIGAAPTKHDQAASTISAGTLGGKVNANASASAAVDTPQVRNIHANTFDLTAGSSALNTGDIYLQYE